MRRTRTTDGRLTGSLLVDKPAGMTSHDVVRSCGARWARRASGTPARSTRSRPGCSSFCSDAPRGSSRILDGEPKVYDATIALGERDRHRRLDRRRRSTRRAAPTTPPSADAIERSSPASLEQSAARVFRQECRRTCARTTRRARALRSSSRRCASTSLEWTWPSRDDDRFTRSSRAAAAPTFALSRATSVASPEALRTSRRCAACGAGHSPSTTRRRSRFRRRPGLGSAGARRGIAPADATLDRRRVGSRLRGNRGACSNRRSVDLADRRFTAHWSPSRSVDDDELRPSRARRCPVRSRAS